MGLGFKPGADAATERGGEERGTGWSTTIEGEGSTNLIEPKDESGRAEVPIIELMLTITLTVWQLT